MNLAQIVGLGQRNGKTRIMSAADLAAVSTLMRKLQVEKKFTILPAREWDRQRSIACKWQENG
jgi:hypothetical protein